MFLFSLLVSNFLPVFSKNLAFENCEPELNSCTKLKWETPDIFRNISFDQTLRVRQSTNTATCFR